MPMLSRSTETGHAAFILVGSPLPIVVYRYDLSKIRPAGDGYFCPTRGHALTPQPASDPGRGTSGPRRGNKTPDARAAVGILAAYAAN